MDEIQGFEQAPQIETPVMEQEKLLPQSQVNKLVAREKENAAARARQQAEEEFQTRLAQMGQAQTQHNATTSREVDAEAVYRQVQEKFNQEMERRRQEEESKKLEAEMSQVAERYISKVNAARESYEDFDAVVGEFDPTAFPQLTYLVSGVENAGDVVYELAKNPSKLVMLDRLAEKNPKQAQNELLKLSRSILENRQAVSEANGQNVSAPLDRLNPSRVSGSSGKMNIRDLRNQPWLRG